MSDKPGDMNLVGRAAIITGANQGLGQAIATAFVDAGASVLLVARGEERLRSVTDELSGRVRNTQAKVLGMRGDIAKVADCQAVVRYAKEALGDVTVLVNNAGIYGPMGPIEEVDWD